jgi:hypothetical protein
MAKEEIIVTEHVLEIRHAASGKFLDSRGFIADYMRTNEIFPHWQIDTNIVQFRDYPNHIESLGGFVGYKSAGLFCYDPSSRNFFEDKVGKFWKTLTKNQFYNIPEIQRFGCRTKAFLNCNKSFEEINKTLYENYFSDKFKSLIGQGEKDLQIVIDLKISGFDMRIMIGPLKKEEARRYFNFESEHFKDTGIYLDIDVSITQDVKHQDIHQLVKSALKETWTKIDLISKSNGI